MNWEAFAGPGFQAGVAFVRIVGLTRFMIFTADDENVMQRMRG